MKRKRTITIGVHGGLVQWIKGIPRDVRVVVHDYDIEGSDAEGLPTDQDGSPYCEAIWEAEDRSAPRSK